MRPKSRRDERMRTHVIWIAALLMAGAFLTLMPDAEAQGFATFEGPHADRAYDANGDGYYNYLEVNATLNVTNAGTFGVEGSLYDETGSTLIDVDWVWVELASGLHTVTLLFDGADVYHAGIDGPYQVSLEVTNETWDVLDTDILMTAPYAYAEFRPPVLMTILSDWGLDTDGDGRYNFLQVNLSMDATLDGAYLILGYYGRTQILDVKYKILELKAGGNIVRVDFSGIGAFVAGESGPYNLAFLVLATIPGTSLLSDTETAESKAYSFTDFEDGDVATLSGRVVKETGEGLPYANIFISNPTHQWFIVSLADGDGNFQISVFDGDFMLLVVSDQQDLVVPVTVSGSTTIDIALDEAGGVHTSSYLDLQDWDNLDLEVQSSIYDDNQSFRFIADLWGNADLTVDQRETDLFLQIFLQIVQEEVKPPEMTEGLFAVDSIPFQMVEGSWDLSLDLKGPVTSTEPFIMNQKASYTSQSNVPAADTHEVMLNVTHDTESEDFDFTVTFPSTWVLMDFLAPEEVQVVGMNQRRVLVDPMMPADGSPPWSTVFLYATGDTTPPVVADVYGTPDPQEVLAPLTITAEIQENSGIVDVSIGIMDPDGNSLGNFTMEPVDEDTYAYTATYDELGVYTYTVWVEDDSGFTGSREGSFTVQDTSPPSADAGQGTNITVGEDVTLDASNSTDNHRIVNYTWTFQDGGEDVTLYGPNPTYTFTRPGTYVITLTVRDAAGNTDTSTVTIIVDEAPLLTTTTLLIVGGAAALIVALGLVYYLMRRRGPGAPEEQEPPPPNF
jgi:hypothetical protein